MRSLGAALLLGLLFGCGGSSRDEDPRPNILLILTDDQRYDTLSCNGSTIVETPELDRIAAEGARFQRAYVTTSLCCPARASLYTGLYPHAHGIRNNEDQVDFLNESPNFPKLLQEAGYATGFFGKWHIHNPQAMPQPGFDRWVSFVGQGNYNDERFNQDGKLGVIEGFNTDVLFDLAIDWLTEERDEPHLAVLSLKNLHRTYEVPERHEGRLADVAFPVPESFGDDPATYPDFIQRVRTTLRNRWFDEDRQEEEVGTVEENVRGYHEMVFSIDDNVGRLREALEASGSWDSTAVLFTSDGGFLWGEHGMYRKRTAYEPSVHIPLLVRYPAEIEAGSEPDQLAVTVDLMPTFLEWAEVEVPKTLHGRSLRPLFLEEDPAWREECLYIDGWGKFVSGPQELALITDRYKLVHYRRAKHEEALFDRQEDPDERHNLIADEAHQDVAADLRARLEGTLANFSAPDTWMTGLAIDEDE